MEAFVGEKSRNQPFSSRQIKNSALQSPKLQPDESSSGTTGPIPWSDVTSFIRQLTHDVRNDLNVLGLESMLLEDTIAQGKATVADLAPMRATLNDAENRLRQLTGKLQQLAPEFSPTRAEDLLEQVRITAERAGLLSADDKWTFDAQNIVIEADVNLLTDAILEVVRNAFYVPREPSRITLVTTGDGLHLHIRILEPMAQLPLGLQAWGVTPLAHGRRGGYGLGLNYAMRIVEAHGGFLKRTFHDEKVTLETLISIPKAAPPTAAR